MSGPFCKSCTFFYPTMIGRDGWGECTDPTKIISGHSGNPVNQNPEVKEDWACNNHTAKG